MVNCGDQECGEQATQSLVAAQKNGDFRVEIDSDWGEQQSVEALSLASGRLSRRRADAAWLPVKRP